MGHGFGSANQISCVSQIWPEDLIPLQPVGRMVLDENVNNFHNESESIAFAPGIFVAGIPPVLLPELP